MYKHSLIGMFFLLQKQFEVQNENSFRKITKNMKNNSEKYIYFLAMKQSIFIIMSMLHFS
mgnify:FL=1